MADAAASTAAAEPRELSPARAEATTYSSVNAEVLRRSEVELSPFAVSVAATTHSAANEDHLKHWRAQFPIRAVGCRLQNSRGERFKLAAVNWYGASDCNHVVGGLDVQSLELICAGVADMGFTVVRLPFSNEMLRCKAVPQGAINFRLNPSLEGLTPLQVFDRVVEALGNVGVAVILNNHTTVGMWSGGAEENGIWFQHGSAMYTEMQWIIDWLILAKRYLHSPHVIGYDLRNEVRPIGFLGGQPNPSWGRGLCVDWSRAAGNCTRSLVEMPGCNGIIIVERVCWPQNSLDEMLRPRPPWQAWDVPRERIVLSLHMYAWSGPGKWSPKEFAGKAKFVLQFIDYVGNRALYGELSETQLWEQMDKEWGFCLSQDLCPVWLSEFGADRNNPREMMWFERMCRYLAHRDVDFAYWPLNVGQKPGGCGDESYGFLANDWTPHWFDPRLRMLSELLPRPPLQGPAAPTGDDGKAYALKRTLPTLEQLRTRSCGSVPRPSGPRWVRDNRKDVVVAAEPHPWSGVLPGPLLPWPGTTACYVKAAEPKDICPARYKWEAYHSMDVDAGMNSGEARGPLDHLKQVCIEGGHGGFVLYKGVGYMRRAHAEDLEERRSKSTSASVLFVPQEVRLCAVWSVERVSAAHVAPLDEGEVVHIPEAGAVLTEWCQRKCVEESLPGFELWPNKPGRARLFPAAAANQLGSKGSTGAALASASTAQAGHHPKDDDAADDVREVHRLQSTLVRIGLKTFPGYDVFPGCNVAVMKNASFMQCRERCLKDGFGGFVVSEGTAYFRTACSSSLEEHLEKAGTNVTTYILTAEEAIEAKGELLEKLLPKLWRPASLDEEGARTPL
mmetsp:Transcript_11175/g.25007  ORF Transcript_11175/g.25007 Transcript_11175/m.25007 type:complete len:844 (+) Transcript_11175:30-2561(+)